MPSYNQQDWGQYVPGLGAKVVQILDARNGVETVVELDTRVVSAFNSAFGRDVGAEWEHTTLNVGIDGVQPDFVSTASIARLRDPTSGKLLYDRDHPTVLE